MCQSNMDKTTKQSKPHETLRNRLILELVTVSFVRRLLAAPSNMANTLRNSRENTAPTYVQLSLKKLQEPNRNDVGIFKNDFITNLRLHFQLSVRGHCLQTCLRLLLLRVYWCLARNNTVNYRHPVVWSVIQVNSYKEALKK